MRTKREETFISIKDVAKKAEVSIATVSRVINNGRVSEQRKVKVLAAIKELNYVPNNSARNLASVNNTKRIKLIVPNINYACYTDIIKGFKMGTKIYKYDPIVADYDNDEIEYQNMNNEIISSSEIRCVIQIGFQHDLPNKVIINLEDELLEIEVDENYLGKKIGLYFPKDDFFTDYFTTNVFHNENVVDVSKEIDTTCDYYIVQSAENAFFLMNHGVDKKIYILEKTPEMQKLHKNISYFPIDFYAVGLTLSRIAIKKVAGQLSEDDESLVLPVVWNED